MEDAKKFKANGILWSSCKEYYREILLELSKKSKIEQIAIYNLKKYYADFIIECYQHDEDVMSDGYINEKIDRLLKDDNTTIVAFTLVIEDANYKYDKKGNLQCVQARNIKELLRKEFSKKVENYFLDNIIHLADNPQESKILKKIFNKYQKYAIKGYLLEGCNPSYAIELYNEKGDSSLDYR